MDFEAAAKLSGARFVVLKGALARLERALMQFMLDLHTREHGYEEINPPVLVRDAAMFGTAQLPKFREDQFLATRMLSDQEYQERIAAAKAQAPGPYTKEFQQFLVDDKDPFWLIPTAEVPMTNLVRDSIVEEKRLPLRFTAGTYAFAPRRGRPGATRAA